MATTAAESLRGPEGEKAYFADDTTGFFLFKLVWFCVV
jgi:hypothetical protein